MRNLDEILNTVGEVIDFSYVDVKSVNQTNVLGDTPLHVVAGWGDAEAVDTLIKAGANVNACGEYGRTPLMAAVRGGSADAVRLILNAGANSLVKEELVGWNALEVAQAHSGEASKPELKAIIELLEAAVAKARSKPQ